METVLNLLEFNKILDKISHEDTIGHLFVVDIKLCNKNPKPMLFNEIYQPIFGKNKNKKVSAHKRSTVHFMSILSRNEQRDIIVLSARQKLTQPLTKKNYPSLC